MQINCRGLDEVQAVQAPLAGQLFPDPLVQPLEHVLLEQPGQLALALLAQDALLLVLEQLENQHVDGVLA